MVLYGIYNEESLMKLINTVQCIHIITSPYEKLYAEQQDTALLQPIYVYMQGITTLFHKLITVPKNCKRKICFNVQRIYNTMAHIADAIRILVKGYLPISLITPLKLKEILNAVRTQLEKLTQIKIWSLKGYSGIMT